MQQDTYESVGQFEVGERVYAADPARKVIIAAAGSTPGHCYIRELGSHKSRLISLASLAPTFDQAGRALPNPF